MANHIEAASSDTHPLSVNLAVQNPDLFAQRSGDDLATGRDHDRVPGVDPFLGIGIQHGAIREVAGEVSGPKRTAASHYPAATFPCDVLQSADPAVAVVIGRRDIDFDPLCIQRIARQGHQVLPADQGPEAPTRGVHYPEAGAIAKTPDHSLRVRRHQLSMPVKDSAIRADDQHGVVEGASAELVVPFVDTTDDRHRVCARRVRQGRQVAALQAHGVLEQQRVNSRTQRTIGAWPQAPHPGRVARHKRLGEHYQSGTVSGRLGDGLHGRAERLVPMQVRGRPLDDCHFRYGHLFRLCSRRVDRAVLAIPTAEPVPATLMADRLYGGGSGSSCTRAGSPAGSTSRAQSIRFHPGTGVRTAGRGTNFEGSILCILWMYLGQFGNTWRTEISMTNWASGYGGSTEFAAAICAMPFTRNRFWFSKSINSIPTWGFSAVLPIEMYMPLPS